MTVQNGRYTSEGWMDAVSDIWSSVSRVLEQWYWLAQHRSIYTHTLCNALIKTRLNVWMWLAQHQHAIKLGRHLIQATTPTSPFSKSRSSQKTTKTTCITWRSQTASGQHLIRLGYRPLKVTKLNHHTKHCERCSISISHWYYWNFSWPDHWCNCRDRCRLYRRCHPHCGGDIAFHKVGQLQLDCLLRGGD